MQSFDRLLQDIYEKSLTEKRSWYSNVAAAYDRARPRYPNRLISRAVEAAQLSPGANLLEIGCGPGIATLSFARLGFAMTCLEPSAAACEIARDRTRDFPNVAIANSTFEEWEIVPEHFDAAIAATSWHWVSDPDKHHKIRTTLKPHGTLILLWNTPPEPIAEIHAQLQDIYDRLAPELANFAGLDRHASHIATFGTEVKASGCFEAIASEEIAIPETIHGDRYLDLLSTLSPYIALDESVRTGLFGELSDRLTNRFQNAIATERLSILQVFRKAG
ncbi:MAG: class I SAM-dependent methyltransferase [Cyanobacteria bacterium J06639_1]